MFSTTNRAENCSPKSTPNPAPGKKPSYYFRRCQLHHQKKQTIRWNLAIHSNLSNMAGGQVVWVNWTLLSLTRARMAHGGFFLSRQVAMVGGMLGTKFPGQFVSIPRHCFSVP
jgi:hypothetical protein